jgi:hypothetical protein
MSVNRDASQEAEEPLSEPISFRVQDSRLEILKAFARTDGLVDSRGKENLTPLLREVVNFYIAERIAHGREAVRAA